MTRLDHLPEIAARNLGGLNADARLQMKIKHAAEAEPARRRQRQWKLVLGSCVAVALCLTIGLTTIPALLSAGQGGSQPSSVLMDSRAAGSEDDTALGRLRALDVPTGGVSVGGASEGTGSYRNLFASDRNGNFPLVIVSGAAYRLLISPTNMKSDLLGESLGAVDEYTLEPALSTGTVVSNVVSAGEPVYAVKGMRGAMAAAYVKGSLRVFQRVSFAGTALLGSETLPDTLTTATHLTAMELTGAGVIDDPATAQQLMQTLLSNAEYDNAALSTGDTRSLLIGLDNGLLMQMMVGDDTISACGTWSCPEFFEAYEAAVAK